MIRALFELDTWPTEDWDNTFSCLPRVPCEPFASEPFAKFVIENWDPMLELDTFPRRFGRTRAQQPESVFLEVTRRSLFFTRGARDLQILNFIGCLNYWKFSSLQKWLRPEWLRSCNPRDVEGTRPSPRFPRKSPIRVVTQRFSHFNSGEKTLHDNPNNGC